MQIVYRKIADLRPAPHNARTHSEEQVSQIVASIHEFGFTNPVLVDENSEIIAGHGRTMAAKALGWVEVPTILLSGLSEAQKRAYCIADNQLSLNAGWDLEILKNEVLNLQSADFDTSLLGFADNFLDDLLRDAIPEGLEAPDAGDPPKNPKSRLGDIWVMGKHKIICGDVTDLSTVEKLMGDEMADLLLTDPPYNVAYEGKTKDALKIENDSMDDKQFEEFLEVVFSNADFALKPGGVFYIWHADSKGYSFRKSCVANDWGIRQCLVWVKNTMVLGRQDYQWKHEPCLYGWKKGAAHFWGSDRKQTTVLEFNKPNASREHPTMKPVDLFEYQIKNSCKPGGTVMDIFSGSGTTILACELTGRIARVAELDPRYVDVAVERWQKMTGQKAIHQETGNEFNADASQ